MDDRELAGYFIGINEKLDLIIDSLEDYDDENESEEDENIEKEKENKERKRKIIKKDDREY